MEQAAHKISEFHGTPEEQKLGRQVRGADEGLRGLRRLPLRGAARRDARGRGLYHGAAAPVGAHALGRAEVPARPWRRCCSSSPTCCCWMSRPTTSTCRAWRGWRTTYSTFNGTVITGQPRPLLPGPRRQEDRRTGPRPGQAVPRQLLRLCPRPRAAAARPRSRPTTASATSSRNNWNTSSASRPTRSGRARRPAGSR